MLEIDKMSDLKYLIDLIKTNPIAKILQNEKYLYLGDNGKIFYSTEVNYSIPENNCWIKINHINDVCKFKIST